MVGVTFLKCSRHHTNVLFSVVCVVRCDCGFVNNVVGHTSGADPSPELTDAYIRTRICRGVQGYPPPRPCSNSYIISHKKFAAF